MLKRPKNTRALVAAGDQARDRKDWPKAAEAYGAAVGVDETLADIWVQFGHALKETGKPDEALKAYYRAANFKPDDADVFLQIGHALKVAGRLPDAADAYANALKHDPTHSDARHELQSLQVRGIISYSNTEDLTVPRRLSSAAPVPIALADSDASSPAAFSVVGRPGKDNSIQLLAHAFVSTLDHLQGSFQFIDSRPDDNSRAYAASVKKIDVRKDGETPRSSLVSVFCDVVANSPQDDNYLKMPPSLVRYAYAVFDSSRLPEFWVTRLNTFDGVLVTDPCLIPVMERSGVYRPVFNLPLALDYGHIAHVARTTPHRPGTTFTFGCVAGFGLRKNLKTLIDAFLDVFGRNEHVKLHLHSSLNFSRHYEEIVAYLRQRGATNVIATCKSLPEQHYAEMMQGFDAYVHVSKGEGFSITPREAMYLGKPTILSDNTAHKTINDTGLTIPIKTKYYEPAVYEALGGGEYGYQCCPDPTSIRDALLQVVFETSRMQIDTAAMRRFAESYSIDALRARYLSVAAPKDVFLGRENQIYDSHIVTTDSNLYSKLSEVRNRLKDASPASGRHRITVMGQDAGFFSLFNTFVSYLVWNIGRADVTSIVPDWRLSEIENYRGLTKFTSMCYGRRIDGNLWLKFFHPVPHQNVPEESYNDHEFLTKTVIYDSFNEQNEPNLTYVHAYRLYKDPNFPQWRRWYNVYVRKYVRFREHLLTQVDLFEATNFDADLIIGCHVRHPSHGMEQPGGRLPTVELFQKLIIERVVGLKSWKIFLATDQQSVVDSFQKLFGNRVLFRADVARVQEVDDRKYEALDAVAKKKEGHQIQHIMASDESKWSTLMGDEVIIDALLLARCQCFIHVTSNIATAVSFLNPDLEMIYCE